MSPEQFGKFSFCNSSRRNQKMATHLRLFIIVGVSFKSDFDGKPSSTSFVVLERHFQFGFPKWIQDGQVDLRLPTRIFQSCTFSPAAPHAYKLHDWVTHMKSFRILSLSLHQMVARKRSGCLLHQDHIDIRLLPIIRSACSSLTS